MKKAASRYEPPPQIELTHRRLKVLRRMWNSVKSHMGIANKYSNWFGIGGASRGLNDYFEVVDSLIDKTEINPLDSRKTSKDKKK